jgi:hypothetical protein
MAVKKKKKGSAAKRKKKSKADANTTCRGGYRKNAGRKPGGKSMARMYQEVINEPSDILPATRELAFELKIDPKEITVGELIVKKWLTMAAQGNATAIKDIGDRIDRQAEMGMSKAQVTTLANNVVDIINRNVMDPEIKARIAEDIGHLVGSVDYADV